MSCSALIVFHPQFDRVNKVVTEEESGEATMAADMTVESKEAVKKAANVAVEMMVV